jgi:hypothetical protein
MGGMPASAASPTCVGTEIATVGQNMTTILASLRAAAPNAEIIALQYYNPLVADPDIQVDTDPIIVALDEAIRAAAASVGGRVANSFAVINAQPELTNVCFYTLMCPGGDVHPSDAGYAAISGMFWASSDYGRLTS